MPLSRRKTLIATALFLALALWLVRSRQHASLAGAPAAPAAAVLAGAARVTAAKAPEPLKKKMSMDEFLSRNDLCAIYRQEVHFDEKEVIDRVLNAPDAYPYPSARDQAYGRLVDALFSPDRDRALDRLSGDDESDPAILLYRGLLKGGLINVSGDPVDTHEYRPLDAIADLEQARERDPANGAYSFFLARLKQGRGFPNDEIRKDLLEATSAPHFETFVTRLVQRVFEKGMSNPQMWLLTNILIASFPVPDYQGWHLFSEFGAGSDRELAEGAIELGKRMMEPTQKYGLEREAVYWFALEHQVGLSLFKEGWKEARPNEEAPPEFLKTYKDWIKRPDAVASMGDLLDPASCSNAWMKKIYERDQADFQRIMIKEN